MPKVSPIQGSFSSGEFDPLVYGRVDSERYKQALAVCKNYIPTIQGGLTRRPGSYYVANTKTNGAAILLPFEFSTEQAYVLEFGNQYIRFYRNQGQIESSPGTPYEIASPYLVADLYQIKFTQSADVLYIVHPSYRPRKLSRTGHTSWTLETITFLDGPYLEVNGTTITLTPGAATGATTLTTGASRTITGAANNGSGLIRITSNGHGFSNGDQVFIAGVTGTTEANGTWIVSGVTTNTFDLVASTFVNAYVANGTALPGLFASTDVGRLIRIKEGSTWGWGTITAFTDVAHVSFTVESTLTNTNAKLTWRLGLWSETTGYPGCVTFHEDRLFFAGSDTAPQRLDGSMTSDYENFQPTAMDGTVADNNAVGFSLNANTVNRVRWMASDEKGLLAGSTGGEWIIRPSAQSEAITPTNISAKQSTFWGSADFQPVQVGKGAVFVQRSGKKFREVNFFFDVDGFRSTDLSILASHISSNGVRQLAYQKEPQSIVWAVRNDGVLIGMTYERDLDSLKVGWHRHIFGGYSDDGITASKVESVTVIPSPDGASEDVWIVTRREVNGSTVRFVEFLTPIFEEEMEQHEAFFVDAGLTYDNPLTIEDITIGATTVIESTAHGLNNGDKVILRDIVGPRVLNGKKFTVAEATTDTFEITGSGSDTSEEHEYVSGGTIRELITLVSGLDHLEGETVSILADGAVLPDQEVVSGDVTLPVAAGTVHVGLGYMSQGQLLRLDAGAADGTSLGKTRRTHRVGFMLHRSLGLRIGMNFDSMDRVTFRTSADPGGAPPALFSGILSALISAEYDFENQIAWEQDQPLPSTILAVMPQMKTEDRG